MNARKVLKFPETNFERSRGDIFEPHSGSIVFKARPVVFSGCKYSWGVRIFSLKKKSINQSTKKETDKQTNKQTNKQRNQSKDAEIAVRNTYNKNIFFGHNNF